MKTLWISLATLVTAVTTACGGGGSAAGNSALSALDFTLATNPASSVQAAQVTGQYVNLAHQDFAWVTAELPAGSNPLAGMQFSPATAPGGGFSGLLSARLDTERGTSAVVTNQRVNLYRTDSASRQLSRFGTIQTAPDGSFVLPLSFLGTIVFASSLPGESFAVSAFADQSATGVGVSISFTATARDAVGAVSFAWDFGDGTSASGANASHAYLAPGNYQVSLSASDASGNIAPAVSTAIVVTSVNPPLTAVNVTVTPQAATPSPLDFDYNATLTGGTGPFTYNWVFNTLNAGVEQATTTTGTASHSFTAPGLFNGTLEVTDSLGASVTANFVSDARIVPVITAINPTEAEPGETVEVVGTGFGLLDGNDRVTLGGLQCVIDQAAGGWTDTSIHVVVPAAAVNGNMEVITELRSNALAFRVLPAAPGGPGGGQF